MRALEALAAAALLIAVAGGCHSTPASPNCGDHVKNGAETDVDCGGPACPNCGTGKSCLATGDCQSKLCGLDHRCTAASCGDKLKNGSESDVDCGGPDCLRCADGLICFAGNDCQSNVCAGGTCVAATCEDGFRNGGEEGVDCGGPCPPCGG